MPPATFPLSASPHGRGTAAVLAVLLLFTALGAARSAGAGEGPLAPLDMSSPRATLDSFTATVDRVAANFKHLDRVGGVRQENARLIRMVLGCFDLSATPPSLVDMKGREAAVHLKEVLDRIPLPARDAVPDAALVKSAGIDRWRLPDTEIALVRIASGPRAGDFVFSADTVARAEEFFERVRHLPYRADAGSPGLFDSYVQFGGWMIPETLIRRLPAWAHVMIGGETVWQWGATALLVLAAAWAVATAARIRIRAAGDVLKIVERLLLPATLVAAGVAVDSLCTWQIRLTGDNLLATQGVARAVMLAGVVTGVLDAVAWATERFLVWRRLGNDSIEGQLVRLATNVGRFLVVAWILIAAADSFGVPVTPLVAGLGAGGLAIALASQYTVENLIAGLVIFADKPVRIGDECQYGSVRGRVERIGLRSTRIRGIDRTVITIPNAEFAKSQLVNFSGRDRIPLSITLTLPTTAGPAAVREQLEKLRALVAAHPGLDPAASSVTLGDPAGEGVTVEIAAVCPGADERAARESRERLLLDALAVTGGTATGGGDASLRLKAA
ncbi:MAG: mechanosensitive ion channel family protein [Planctomycetia bacterium]